MHQSFNHLGYASLQYVCVSPVLRSLQVDIIFQVWPHQCWVEGKDHLPWPTGSILSSAALDTTSILCPQGHIAFGHDSARGLWLWEWQLNSLTTESFFSLGFIHSFSILRAEWNIPILPLVCWVSRISVITDLKYTKNYNYFLISVLVWRLGNLATKEFTHKFSLCSWLHKTFLFA